MTNLEQNKSYAIKCLSYEVIDIKQRKFAPKIEYKQGTFIKSTNNFFVFDNFRILKKNVREIVQCC